MKKIILFLTVLLGLMAFVNPILATSNQFDISFGVNHIDSHRHLAGQLQIDLNKFMFEAFGQTGETTTEMWGDAEFNFAYKTEINKLQLLPALSIQLAGYADIDGANNAAAGPGLKLTALYPVNENINLVSSGAYWSVFSLNQELPNNNLARFTTSLEFSHNNLFFRLNGSYRQGNWYIGAEDLAVGLGIGAALEHAFS